MRYETEGYRVMYLTNTDDDVLAIAVRGTYSPQAAQDQILLSLASIEELGTAEEPFWTSFCKYKGSYLHLGKFGNLRLDEYNGVRCLPENERPQSISAEEEQWIVEAMVCANMRIARITRDTDTCAKATDDEPGEPHKVTVRVDSFGEVEVEVTGDGGAPPRPRRVAKRIAHKRRATEGARRVARQRELQPEAIIAMLGHVSPEAAARTVERSTGRLQARVNLEKLHNFEPKFPFNVAAAGKNLNHSHIDYSHFRAWGWKRSWKLDHHGHQAQDNRERPRVYRIRGGNRRKNVIRHNTVVYLKSRGI